jgi:hypothetical protein
VAIMSAVAVSMDFMAGECYRVCRTVNLRLLYQR